MIFVSNIWSPLPMPYGKLPTEISRVFELIAHKIDSSTYQPIYCEKEFIDEFHNNYKIITDTYENGEHTGKYEIIIKKEYDNIVHENNYQLMNYRSCIEV